MHSIMQRIMQTILQTINAGRIWLCVLPLCLLAAASGGGIDVRHHFSEPADKVRYEKLIRELRCLVCQNQTLAESDAELASDMRGIVANMIKDGAADSDIYDFLHARYGDFIRYRPPLRTDTWLLWLSPFVLVFALLLMLPIFARRRRIALTAEQKSRAESMLEE